MKQALDSDLTWKKGKLQLNPPAFLYERDSSPFCHKPESVDSGRMQVIVMQL
jgi:hypothetical protein